MSNKEEIKQALEEVFKEQTKSFYIEKEKHYEDHKKVQLVGREDIEFLIAARGFVESLKDAFWRTMVKGLVVLGLTVITGGVYAYFKYGKHIPHGN